MCLEARRVYMLTELSITNLAVVSKTACEFKNGLSVVTGETGAGKSMLIDALSWIMGERASVDMIRDHEDHAEVAARFDLSTRDEAKAWLAEQDLQEENECLIRRIVTKEGRSRAYVNGKPVTVQTLKNLADFLLNIHSQHQHLALLKSEYQLELLDHFGNHEALLNELKTAFHAWQSAHQTLQHLMEAEKFRQEKQALLVYQCDELSTLQLQADEWLNLNKKQKMLAAASAHAQLIEEALSVLENEQHGNIRNLHLVHQKLIDAEKVNPAFNTLQTLFSQALVILEEARSELNQLGSRTELDPETTLEVEKRLSQLFDAARKHKVRPEDLYQHFENLKISLQEIDDFHVQQKTAETALQANRQHYENIAQKLSTARKVTAEKLNQAVNEMLPTVALKHAEFEIQLITHGDEPRVNGYDSIVFLIATGPQQQKAALAKVVSGGELSRISLIIQVLTKGQKRPPCLVFDEVDTGISGQTASVVGKLLQKLSRNTQIICITHLPQVAALGDHHYRVSKDISGTSVESHIQCLDEAGRLDALAALLGGLSSKQAALTHAKALREEASIE